MEDMKIIKPLLATLAIALAFLFIGERLSDNNCGCGGSCVCSCETECSRSCECGLVECKGGGGYEYAPEE